MGFCSSALAGMDLRIEIRNDSLLVLIINNSEEKVIVNRFLSLGPEISLSNLRFVFKNIDGKKYPFTSKVDGKVPDPQDYFTLYPSAIIGKAFSLKSLESEYDLVPGEYKIQALYEDRNKIISPGLGLLRSNELTFKMEPE